MGSHWSYFIDTAKLQGGETLQIENYPKIKNKLPKAADLLRDLPKLKHIVVRYCKLTTLPTDLNLLSSLTHLDLEGNNFREFPIQLKSLTNLKTLIIRRNQYENFPVIVSELKLLTLLDVSDNQIERIPYKLAYGFPELQTLHYARNNLKVFPEAIADLKSLTFLNLSGNKLQDLGSVISQLTNLQKLVLSHNAFEEVPHIIRRFTKLEHLDLSNNKLTKCEDVLPSLTNLKRLELQHNVLEVVTDEMVCLPNLEVLKLNDNRISKITPNISQLQKLEELYLHENLLTSLPSSFGSLCSLKKLFLEFNHLQALPIELTKLDKLHWLFLHNNKLNKIPEALRNISFLTNLVALSLGNNDFEPNQQRNIATSGALNYCIKRAQDTLKAKEAFSQMRQERNTTTFSLSKQNFLQRAASSSRLPRFSRSSMGSSIVIEDPTALVKAFENLLGQHDFSDKLKENLRLLPAIEKLNFLSQYQGISLNLLTMDSSPNVQSSLHKSQTDDSVLRRGGDSSERNLSQNKVTNFFNVVKEKIHKDKEREIDSGLQISRAQSTGTISSVLSHSSTHDSSQTSNNDKDTKSKRKLSLPRLTNLRRTHLAPPQLQEEQEDDKENLEKQSSQQSSSSSSSSSQNTRSSSIVRDRSFSPSRRRTKSGDFLHKKRSLSAEDNINLWIGKLTGNPTPKDLFSLRVRFLSSSSSWWIREFITSGGVNAIFKILTRPLDKDTLEDEGLRLEALRILNVLFKADLSSMLMLSDAIPIIAQNLLCSNDLIKQHALKVLLCVVNAGGIYQGIVAEALIKVTKLKGPTAIYLQLFKGLNDDCLEEFTNVKACMTLINIIIEKSESLEVRFENFCHFLAMRILKVFKKIRQTVAKQSLSGDIKELLEEITIFEQQLVNDIETLSNQLGRETVIERMRSHVYNYLNILSKKKPDESPFLYDPSNESLLRSILHSPCSPNGEWMVRVRIPKYQGELQLVIDPKTGCIGDRTAYRENSRSNSTVSLASKTSQSYSFLGLTPPETPSSISSTPSDSPSPLQSFSHVSILDENAEVNSETTTSQSHYSDIQTRSPVTIRLSSNSQSSSIFGTTNVSKHNLPSMVVSEKFPLPPVPPPPTLPPTPHMKTTTTTTTSLPSPSAPLPPPLNISPSNSSTTIASKTDTSNLKPTSPSQTSTNQLTVGHLLRTILNRIHTVGVKLSGEGEEDDNTKPTEDEFSLYCIVKRDSTDKHTPSNANTNTSPILLHKTKSISNTNTKNITNQNNNPEIPSINLPSQTPSESSHSIHTLDSPASRSSSSQSSDESTTLGMISRKPTIESKSILSSDEDEEEEVSSAFEFWMDNNTPLSDYKLDRRECILELRRKPVNIRVKTFGDTYEEMSFNLNHTISKIKKELANKILDAEQRKLWNSDDYCLILETVKQESIVLDDTKPLLYYKPQTIPLKTLRLALRPHPIRVCEYRQPSQFITVDVFFTYPLKVLIIELCRRFGIPFPSDSTTEHPLTSRIPYALVYHDKTGSKGKLLNLSSSLRGQGIAYNEQGYFELTPVPTDIDRDQSSGIWSSKEKDDLILDQNKEIQAVSLNVLIELLTSEGDFNQEDLNTFVLTYQSFTTPEVVLQKLRERWRVPDKVDSQTRQSIQVRILVFLKYWIEYSQDALEDTTFRNDLKTFAQEIYDTDVKYQGSALALLKQIDSKQPRTTPDPLNSFTNSQLSNTVQNNASERLTSVTNTKFELDIVDIDEMELAKQLTYFICESFFKIKPHELLGQVWNDLSQVAYLAPNVHATIRHFNYTSNFVTRSIVLETKLKNRRKIYKKFIKVAKYLRDMKNFHSLTAVLSGLSNAAVSRLTWTRKISKSYRAILKDLEALMSMEGGFRNYRQALEQCLPPCIPYMGAVLMDLTFIEDGNLDNIGTLINWSKRKALYKILNKIIYYQTTTFDVKPQPEIQALLRQTPQLDEAELYEVSLLREPPNCKRTDLE